MHLRIKCPMNSVYFKKQAGHYGPGSLTRVIFPTIEFYIFVPLVPTCDPQFRSQGASYE